MVPGPSKAWCEKCKRVVAPRLGAKSAGGTYPVFCACGLRLGDYSPQVDLIYPMRKDAR